MMTARPWTSLPLALLALVAACNLIDGAGDPDGGPSPSAPTTDLARIAISTHDDVRAHASPTPSPALPGVQWSAEVEAVAQQWANHCVYEHDAARGNLGENIAASSPGFWTTIAGPAGAWAGEAADYDYASNSCATGPGKQCGHYTQMVWRESTLIGCAYARCTENSPFPGYSTWDFWVCDYSPPGNWLGQRPY